MPYIDQLRRADIDGGMCPQTCGELNYQLTITILRHGPDDMPGLKDKIEAACRRYLTDAPLRYQRINDVAGALVCCAYELERRCKRDSNYIRNVIFPDVLRSLYYGIAAPYEDQAILKNGDIDYDPPIDRSL